MGGDPGGAAARRAAWLILAAGLLTVALALALGAPRSVDELARRREQFEAITAQDPLAVGAAFFALFVLAAASGLPVVSLLSVASGLMFGLFVGTAIAALASALGGMLGFWLARTLLRGPLQRRHGELLRRIEAGFRRDGAYHLFTLRMVAVLPFGLINAAFALTPIRASTFYWVTQLGMLASTAIYVNAGAQLRDVAEPRDLLAPDVLLSLALLGLAPLAARRLIRALRRRRARAALARRKEASARSSRALARRS